jgi:hypothetical protein
MNDLTIPQFLRRSNPSTGEDMTHQEKKQPEPSQADLEHRASVLTKDIAGIDGEIKTLSTERALKHKELRSITSKLVTLKLKSN